ncbi:hypothetical protein M951_chr3122 (nucleomorph) [Lotharella oceanica]|uniref:Uncharacterized protein n=1 Tax=Lotharella oceanica TaxID=641309 RepID=A0A060DC07_9EUKA|nr:hypothetical protein M951_chr3122 [Lotharella oceanica]
MGFFLNNTSFVSETTNFLSEISKFYETYLFKIFYITKKKIEKHKNLIKIQDYLIKNILIRYLKKKIMYTNKREKYEKHFDKISYYTSSEISLQIYNNNICTHILNFLYKNFEIFSCILYIKNNWELKKIFFRNFFQFLCFSSKNFFCAFSWINKIELFFFNLIVLEFDSFLYDNFLYLHITHILLNNYSHDKKILIFYRSLNFNKFSLIPLLKKLYSKKLGNLVYIYKTKKKIDLFIILENLQCVRKSQWFLEKYYSQITKFCKIFILQNNLSIYVKNISVFFHILNIEILISFLFFLYINGISKLDISIYLNKNFNLIEKTFKNTRKFQIVKKNYIFNKNFQGLYKKIIIFNEKINFSTFNINNFKLMFKIITHAKEILVSFKINLYSCSGYFYNNLKPSLLSFCKTKHLYEKLFNKNNTIFKYNNMFIIYLINYFLLLYTLKIKLFFFFYRKI